MAADEHPAAQVGLLSQYTEIGYFDGVTFQAGEWCVNAIAVGPLGGRDVIVTGGDDKLLRLWDADGRELAAPGTAHIAQIRAVVVGRLAGRDVIATVGLDGQLIVWDVDCRPLLTVRPEHGGKLEALAIRRVGGRPLLAAAGGGDHSVTVWEWADGGLQVSRCLVGHTGYVRGIAIGRLAGRDVIATAGDDRTVRVWDPAGGDDIVIDLLEPPTAVAIDDGVLFAATGPSVVAVEPGSAGWPADR
jgi:WD40 repeat protein